MSDADLNRAARWLYAQRRDLIEWHRDGPSGAVAEALGPVLAGVEALEAVGAIGEESASYWRDALRRAAAGEAPSVEASDDIRAAATDLLAELLAAVPNEPDWDDATAARFEGAVELLAAIGAVDPVAWEAELRQHTGEPTEQEELDEIRRLNAGGTEIALAAVIPGPPERRNGYRLLVTLRFADGITFLFDKDGAPGFEWPAWALTDDFGNEYVPGGSGGGDGEEHVTFRTAPPVDARWVQITHEQDPAITFRVML